MKTTDVLGMNARSRLYTGRYNSRRAKKIADSKIQTDKVLKKAGVPKPEILAKFKDSEDIFKFDWNSLPSKFALKPSRGLGGDGIIVVKKKLEDGVWMTSSKQKITAADLKLHVQDILEGAYSMGNEPDVAFIQEFVGRHKAFRKYAFRGTPDIRIIVFNKIPVMAMLRLPTKESGGRANLHQGAIAVGIDIATGITTRALWHGEYILLKPGTKRKLRGIKIPKWNTMLRIAVEAQIASGLGYCGVDIVLHPEKGPMIIELNAQPGLQIQLANGDGLRKRLRRVDEMEVRDAEHGVSIAKALFAGRFADRVKAEEGVKTIKAVEEIKIRDVYGKKHKLFAKIDTGAWSSSIDRQLARDLGILKKSNILWYKRKLSALGEEQRPVLPVTFYLAGRRIDTYFTVSDRSKLTYPALIGRTDLQGFLVNPEIDKDKIASSS